MTVRERLELLAASIPQDDRDPRSRRYAMRRTTTGLELFEAKWTREVAGEQEFHGHPTRYIPGRLLRRFLERGDISRAEYERLRKELSA